MLRCVLRHTLKVQEMALTEGPPILAASISLDGSLVALQRSPVRLEFVSCKTQKIFVQVCVSAAVWCGSQC